MTMFDDGNIDDDDDDGLLFVATAVDDTDW